MISYTPFYQTLLKKGITEYHLIYKQGMSANTIQRMKEGKSITLKTLDTICFILDCDITDVIVYTKDDGTAKPWQESAHKTPEEWT